MVTTYKKNRHGLVKRTASRFTSLTAAIVLAVTGLGGSLPLLLSQEAYADSISVVTPVSHSTWSDIESQTGGTVSFVSDSSAPSGSALELTTGATANAKAHYQNYFTSPVALSAISNDLSYATKQNSAAFTAGDPAYQITVNVFGNSGYNNFTYEPYVDQGNAAVKKGIWHTWNVGAGKFYSSHSYNSTQTHDGSTIVAGQGQNTYTLAQIRAAFPDASVTGVAVNVGSNNPSYNVEADSLKFNGITYDFNTNPTPTTVYVDPSYTSANAGTHTYGYDAFNNIQDGVNAVATSGTVDVDAGTYTEAVSVSNSLTIDGASGATLNGQFNILANGVTIDGFTVNDSRSAVIVTGADNISLTNNTIDKSAGYIDGFEFNSAPSNNVTISGNTFNNGDSNNDSNADISFVGDPSQVSHGLVVSHNTSTNGATFINLGNLSGASIHDNTVTGASGSAIYFAGNDVSTSVNNNTITGGAGTAMNVSNYFYGPSFYTTISHNNLSGNATGIKASSNTTNVNAIPNAQENWWGHASGPTDTNNTDGSTPASNPNGTGTPALGAVDYSNWCTLSDCSTLSNVAPGAPTNLSAKFQYDGTNIANGSTLNITAKPGGNNLELTWDAGTGWVNGYHILVTYPNGDKDVSYQGPNTNAWLSSSFGQHGNGAYTYTVEAVNDSGNSTPSASFTLYYDTHSPVATFTTAPDNNSFVNGNFKVSATVSDDSQLSGAGFDVRNSSGYVNGCVPGTLTSTPDPIAGSQSATLSCTINTSNLVDGQKYYVRIHAGDYAGYGSKDSTPQSVRNFTFDNTKPTVAISSPAANQTINGRTVTIKGTVNDDNFNYYYCYVTDSHGEIGTRDAHCNTTWAAGTPFETSTSSTATGTTNGTLGSVTLPNNLADGTYTVHVVAKDKVGNTTEATQDFVLDNTKPTAKFTSATTDPTPNGTYNSNFNVGYEVSDNTALKYVNVTLFDTVSSHTNHYVATCYNNSNETTNDDKGTCTVHLPANLVDGKYYVQVGGQDTAGNYTVNAIRFVTIDRTAPSAPTPVSPSDGASLTTAALNKVDWTDVSDSSAPVTYRYEVSNSSATNPDGSFVSPVYVSGVLTTSEIATPNTPAGTYYWHSQAVDNVGNTSKWSTTWSYTVDNTAPAVPTNVTLKDASGNAINDGGSTNSYTTTVSWTGPADAVHYVYKVWDNIPGNTYNGEVNAYTTDVNGTSRSGDFNQGEGTYYIEVASVDAAGNVSAFSPAFTVTYDNTAPSANAGTDQTVTGKKKANLSGSSNDNTASYSWQQTSGPTNGTSSFSDANAANPTVTVSKYGTYTFQLTTTDSANNSSSDSVKVTFSKLVSGGGPSNGNNSKLTLTNNNLQVARTGSVNANGNTNGGNTGTGNAVNTSNAVLGANTTTPSTSGKVKGASTTNKELETPASATSDSGFNWNWLWLLLLLLLAPIYYYVRKRSDNTNS